MPLADAATEQAGVHAPRLEASLVCSMHGAGEVRMGLASPLIG